MFLNRYCCDEYGMMYDCWYCVIDMLIWWEMCGFFCNIVCCLVVCMLIGLDDVIFIEVYYFRLCCGVLL